jgi:uncharacterized protein (TIGR03118 family)
MEDVPMARRPLALLASLALVALVATPAVARNPNSVNAYRVTVLQSDASDPSLVNGWGIVAGPTTPWWVANNGTDTSTLYNGTTGAKVALTVGVAGGPTGVVFNGGTAFPVADGSTTASRFIFATLSGTIQGWAGGAAATVRATSPDDGSYTGLAIGTANGAPYLYAADFANGRVDVFDGSFARQEWAGAFTDPGLPAGYAPFGIQNLAGTIYVAYALRGADGDEVHGEGLGAVSAFGTDGSFLGRVATGGALDAPWGLAWAPASWGRFANHLLVGNFGNGTINAYRPTSGGWEARGHLKQANHRPLVIDGLWGIGFGNGAPNNGPTSTLFFAAGPDDETGGAFGTVTAVP